MVTHQVGTPSKLRFLNINQSWAVQAFYLSLIILLNVQLERLGFMERRSPFCPSFMKIFVSSEMECDACQVVPLFVARTRTADCEVHICFHEIGPGSKQHAVPGVYSLLRKQKQA